jgi:hypothetical protein
MKPLEDLFAFLVDERYVGEVNQERLRFGQFAQHRFPQFPCPHSCQTPLERHRELSAFLRE